MKNGSTRENCYFVKLSDVHLYNKVQLFKSNFIKIDILKILPFDFINVKPKLYYLKNDHYIFQRTHLSALMFGNPSYRYKYF